MLVLTRKEGQVIRIGDDIVIRVNSIKGNRVRIGIEAPGDYSVSRPEQPRRKDDENDEEPRKTA